MRRRGVLDPLDLPWAAYRLGRKAWFTALPIGAHHEIATLRGKLAARRRPGPDPVRENLSSTVGLHDGPDELDALVRRTHAFEPVSRLVGIMPRLRGFEDPARWSIAGLEELDAALERRRGAILVGAHLGYGLLTGTILRLEGYPVVRVMAGLVHRAERERRARWTRTGTRFRRWIYERTRVVAEFTGPKDIAAGIDVRPIFAALESSQVVLLAGDGRRAAEFAWHPFLGRPYPFPTGFVKIAMRAECPVLPVFAVEGSQRHQVRIEIGRPLEIDASASAAENVGAYARVLEEQIRRTPHLWSRWSHPGLFESAKLWAESDFTDRYERVWAQGDPQPEAR